MSYGGHRVGQGVILNMVLCKRVFMKKRGVLMSRKKGLIYM